MGYVCRVLPVGGVEQEPERSPFSCHTSGPTLTMSVDLETPCEPGMLPLLFSLECTCMELQVDFLSLILLRCYWNSLWKCGSDLYYALHDPA